MKTAIRSFWLAALALLLLAGAAQALDPPGKTYLDYSNALAKAQSLTDILPFLSTTVRLEISKQPVSKQTEMLQVLKQLAPTQLNITRETITGKKAIVYAEGISPEVSPTGATPDKTYGIINLVREVDGWKINKEDWSNTPPPPAR